MDGSHSRSFVGFQSDELGPQSSSCWIGTRGSISKVANPVAVGQRPQFLASCYS